MEEVACSQEFNLPLSRGRNLPGRTTHRMHQIVQIAYQSKVYKKIPLLLIQPIQPQALRPLSMPCSTEITSPISSTSMPSTLATSSSMGPPPIEMPLLPTLEMPLLLTQPKLPQATQPNPSQTTLHPFLHSPTTPRPSRPQATTSTEQAPTTLGVNLPSTVAQRADPGQPQIVMP